MTEPGATDLRGCKLLRIITRLNVGGPAIHCVLLTGGLESYGYETLLVTGSCEPEDGDMGYLLEPGDPVRWAPSMSRSAQPLKNVRALWEIWRIMRAERPTIVHTHTAMAGALGRLAAILNQVPIVVHTFHGNSLRHYFSPLVSGIFLQMERWLARFTDVICVVSAQQAEELSGGFHIAPRDKFRVVPLGLDLDSYLSVPPAEPGEWLNVGWLGRLVAVKNIPLLVASMEATLARSSRIRFYVAGDGPEKQALQLAMQKFGDRIVWLGWQQDVLPLIARCHVLIQTSRNEGTPVALIQGMAAARPFISTPVGGVVDMVEGPPLESKPGQRWFSNGVLAESEPAVFANILAQLAEKPELAAEMGLAARKFAAARYRTDVLFRNLDALYRELMDRKGIAVKHISPELLVNS